MMNDVFSSCCIIFFCCWFFFSSFHHSIKAFIILERKRKGFHNEIWHWARLKVVRNSCCLFRPSNAQTKSPKEPVAKPPEMSFVRKVSAAIATMGSMAYVYKRFYLYPHGDLFTVLKRYIILLLGSKYSMDIRRLLQTPTVFRNERQPAYLCDMPLVIYQRQAFSSVGKPIE